MTVIASWNVNSLKVRLPQVLAWLEEWRPDVLALQETKLADAAFPVAAFEEAGWHVVHSGQKTYNGVALIGREPLTEVVTDPPTLADPQRRILAATTADGVRVLNLYVPNGQAVGSDKYRYKLDWLQRVARYVEAELGHYAELAVVGDFNIAPADADVHDPAEWAGQVLCSEPEREALRRVLDAGLRDTFRLFDQAPGLYSWWDYRANAFRRGRGLRIDLILASDTLCGRCAGAEIDQRPRANERPSDHAPVLARFDRDAHAIS